MDQPNHAQSSAHHAESAVAVECIEPAQSPVNRRMQLGATGFALLLLLSTLVKLWLAWRLPLFGDEAFYWLESRQLEPAFLDVPVLTPALIALGTSVAGDSELGLRWPFVLFGLALPLLVYAWARAFVPAPEARWLGAVSLLLPLAAINGVFALPDVALTAVIVALARVLLDALARNRWRDFALLGALLALGWLTHYRFALIVPAGLAFVCLSPRGRTLLRNPRAWLALAIGCLGLLPAIWVNAANHWQAFAFHLIERHAWRPHWQGATEPLVQALIVTPLLFAALLLGGYWACKRGVWRREPWDVLLWCGGGFLATVLGLGLVADAERLRLHWAMPAYLLLLPLLPAVLERWRAAALLGLRVLARATLPLAASGALLLLALLASATAPAPGFDAAPKRAALDNLAGWHETGAWVRELAAHHPQATLIADNFMLGAQTEFALAGARPVYVLPHPANRKHGRQAQLALLGRAWAPDRALPAAALLLVEPGARREADRWPAMLALCERFPNLQWLDELVLHGGHWRVLAFQLGADGARLAAGGQVGCQLPPRGGFNALAPLSASEHSWPLDFWIEAEAARAQRIEVLIDDRVVARIDADFAIAAAPGAEPSTRRVLGFKPSLDARALGLAPGRHRLALRVTDAQGRTRLVAQVEREH